MAHDLSMNLHIKAEENKRVAMKCINIDAYNAGISRAYYSVFQKIKSYLIANKFDYDNFVKQKYNGIQKPFSHGTIQHAAVECMVRQGKNIQDFSALFYIDDLYKKRKEADYTEKQFAKQDLTMILDEVKNIFDVLC